MHIQPRQGSQLLEQATATETKTKQVLDINLEWI